jgi:hypothetical protein
MFSNKADDNNNNNDDPNNLNDLLKEEVKISKKKISSN